MTRLNNFSDAFWDSDFCGTNGYDALCRRMKEGRHIGKDFDEFIKTRAKIEEDYGKALMKLAKSQCGNGEIGTLKQAFDVLRAQTERMGEAHMQANQAMMKASNRLNDFLEQQKTKRKQEETAVTKSMRKKTDLHRQMMNAKKNCDQKCRDADQMDLQVNTTKNSGAGMLGGKEWEKLRYKTSPSATQMAQPRYKTSPSATQMAQLYAKQTRTRNEADRADASYKSLVGNLDQARLQWEKEMIHMCSTFQQLETDRIQWLRNEMWFHVNVISQTCVDDDNHCEELRNTLEQCDVNADLEHFINERKTGLDRPAAIPYEPYQSLEGKGKPYGVSRPPQPPPGHRPTEAVFSSAASDQEKTFL